MTSQRVFEITLKSNSIEHYKAAIRSMPQNHRALNVCGCPVFVSPSGGSAVLIPTSRTHVAIGCECPDQKARR
ncbi:hypothetical protein [Desulfoluna spongiiphila]|uniref:Uncharacterized protein n=1 Tax=Desulfoluna spongiiphila TaxID=419481 RepID=A0A1G5G0Z3_9BACT|nr:hypothetical protein [Desulfoluna spongiiphila]SCY45124.1 hypothetical protein SAMN05216233_109131 [Desulfoluna spongiiphila]